MDSKHALLFVFLHLILILLYLQGASGENMDSGESVHGGGHLHLMGQMDPSVIVFFRLDDLKQGNKMPIYFPRRKPSIPLSKQESDSIPFSSKHLPFLLRFFSFSADSPQAMAMEDTLRQCDMKPIKGETKLCATSLQSALDFAQTALGFNSKIQALSTTHLTTHSHTPVLQNYTVLSDPEEIPARKMVACHSLPYPYAVFYCHYQESRNSVFKVELIGENYGDRVEAIAVCHMDTSHWSRNHVSFRVLGIEAGPSPVCHFFPSDNFVWVPSPAFGRVRSPPTTNGDAGTKGIDSHVWDRVSDI